LHDKLFSSFIFSQEKFFTAFVVGKRFSLSVFKENLFLSLNKFYFAKMYRFSDIILLPLDGFPIHVRMNV
jgi:hypothetical protein